MVSNLNPKPTTQMSIYHICTGTFLFSRAQAEAPFEKGAFIGEMHSLHTDLPLTASLVCAQDGSFYYITKKALLKFFEDNPGVLIYFKDRRFVE